MGLKDRFNQAKCAVGLHVGEWRRADPAACDFHRTCERCAKVSTKVEHAYGEWEFTGPDTCERQQVCAVCADRQTGVEHTWGEAVYAAEGDCTQVEVCARCGATGSAVSVEHTWGSYELSAAKDAKIRLCSRCGEVESTPISAEVPAAAETPDPDAERAAQFEALKPKMQQIAEMNEAMENVLDDLATQYEALAEEASSTVDHRLVGHWRGTSFLGGGGMSLTTDVHLVLNEDGTYESWHRSIGPAGETTSEPDVGRWEGTGSVLALRSSDGDGGGAELDYEVEGGDMIFPHQANLPTYWQRL